MDTAMGKPTKKINVKDGRLHTTDNIHALAICRWCATSQIVKGKSVICERCDRSPLSGGAAFPSA